MLKKVTLLGAIAASALVATSAAMAAGGGNSENARDAAACVQAGVGTLVSLNLIDEAAQGKLNYYPLGRSQAEPVSPTSRSRATPRTSRLRTSSRFTAPTRSCSTGVADHADAGLAGT